MKQWIKKPIFWVIVICVLVAAIYFLRPKKKSGARTMPNTEYSGQTQELDPEVMAKNYKLDRINPVAYGRPSGVVVEEGTAIAVIGKQKGTPYWDAVLEGAEDAVADLNTSLHYEGSDAITLTYDAPNGSESAEEQINILDETLGRNPSAICIAMIDEQAYEMQFDQAADNGIPVVALDSGNDNDVLQSKASTDNYKAAKTIAKYACEGIAEQGTIAIIVHDDSSETAHERVRGMVEEIEKNHPDIRVGQIIYADKFSESELEEQIRLLVQPEPETVELEEENVTAESEVLTEEESYPIPDAVLATNISTLSACETVWTAEGFSIPLYGFDGGSDEIEALQEGSLQAFILQNPYGMGYAAVIAACRGIAEQGNEYRIDTGYVLVDAKNCETDEVNALLYQ